MHWQKLKVQQILSHIQVVFEKWENLSKKFVNFSIWIPISTRIVGSLTLENLGWTLPMLETYVGHWNYYIGYVTLEAVLQKKFYLPKLKLIFEPFWPILTFTFLL